MPPTKQPVEIAAHNNCSKSDFAFVRDALQTLNGTWKIPILMSLNNGSKRFKEIAKDVEGISDKMLSKELKDLELNHLITRTVYDSFPPTVEYAQTAHAKSLYNVMTELRNWGALHRKKVIGK